ncbi:MAG: GAF domain-containing protein [Magnetococcales bacterium]|nr:GAF domain-containing protein [Magnetococcales bacterium]
MEKEAKPPFWSSTNAAVGETVLFLAGMYFIDLYFFNGDRFWSVSPHPFWAIVLLISVQYGTGPGLFAATLSSLVLLVGNIPQQTIHQDIHDHLFLLSHLPLMWFGASVIFGELTLRHIRAKKKLAADLLLSEKQAAKISTAFTELNIHKEKLEVQAAGQMRSVISTYKAARAIEQLDPAMVLYGVADMISAMMSPVKFSLYTLNNDHLQAGIQRGWNAQDVFVRIFKPDSPLFQAVIVNKKYLCVARHEDEEILVGEGVLAGPIQVGGDGRILGMLKIEDQGFMNLNLTTVENFKVVCQWIGTVYNNAQRFKDAKQNSLFSMDQELYSNTFFNWQMNFLQSLSKRTGIKVSIAILRLENHAELSSETRTNFPHLVKTVMYEQLRNIDLGFEYRGTSWEVALLLPNTDIAKAPVVAEKIQNALKSAMGKEKTEIKFVITTHQLGDWKPK